jgi:hypothetical protein
MIILEAVFSSDGGIYDLIHRSISLSCDDMSFCSNKLDSMSIIEGECVPVETNYCSIAMMFLVCLIMQGCFSFGWQ